MCNNMLYPAENKELKRLKFLCKVCGYSETLDENLESSNMVYKNEVKLGQTQMMIDPCIIHDPTYGRTKNIICDKCGWKEAIFFHNLESSDSGMKLIFVCCGIDNETYCGNWWENKSDV